MSSSTMQRHSRRMSRRFSSVDTSNISEVVFSLKRRSSEELGSATSAKLMNVTHEGILDWIRSQRMSHVPPEGSSYDKVLAWAQLFIERLHSFDLAIEDFAGDSYLATQLTYGYCSILLNLGRENAEALMVSFGFFYNMSMSLANLLDRIELFSVSQDIREQLVMALSDLVTLVASVSIRFHKATRGLTKSSVTVDIYNSFPGEIKSFVERCDKTAESMWRHQLLKDGMDAVPVSTVKAIRTWLTPEDAVSASMGTVSHLAHDREELTCLWMAPYLTRFLKGSNDTMSIYGKRGSGKSVLASVIVDYLQHPIGGNTYKAIYVPINNRAPAQGATSDILKAILCQLFQQRIGNVQLLQILSEAMERCARTTNDSEYEKVVWVALERSLQAALVGAKELIIVVDGLDEAVSSESDLVQRLHSATSQGSNVKLIALGTQKPSVTSGVTNIQITDDLIFDDIMAVVRGLFEHGSKVFRSMHEMERESIVSRIVEASHGSFLFAKLAAKRLRDEETSDKLSKELDSLSSHTSILDFVTRTIQANSVSEDAKMMLLWLATAERPLSLKTLLTLTSIHVDKKTINDRQIDTLSVLRPVNSLVFLQDGQVCLRHGLVREAILEMQHKGKLVSHVKDPHAELATRLLFYIKHNVTQEHDISLNPLDAYETQQLLNKFPMLDFAVRYWPYHLRRTTVFTKDGEAAVAKTISHVFPTSNTVLLLQNALWVHKATPTHLIYLATTTNICRHLLTSNDPITLQSIITLVLLCRQVGLVQECIPMFYEATNTANSILGSRSTVTLQMASGFLELTFSMTTKEKTDIMKKREDLFLVLIECYKVQYGQRSEIVITTMHQLVEHYHMIHEEHKAKELLVTIEKMTSVQGSIEAESGLHVHLRRGHEKTQTSMRLFLDVEEHDEKLETAETQHSFEYLFKQAERYVSEGRMELAEHSYIEAWQRISREYRRNHSEVLEKKKMQVIIGYSKFLQSQKRYDDCSSVLCSFWEEYRQSNVTFSETSMTHFTEMAKIMTSIGMYTGALSILKHCKSCYQNTSRTQTSSYKEIQEAIHTNSRQIMQSVESSETVVSESTLREMVLEASSSIETMEETSFTAAFSMVKLYMSQHRWQEATRSLKRVLQGIWPSLFASTAADVTPPSKHVDSCVELAERLAECYRARRRITKEEDLRMRLYHCIRTCRPVNDSLRERVTSELISFLDRTLQTDTIITVRQEMLDDYTEFYSPEHQTVIKMLWELAELARPRPVFVEYYQRIIKALNKNSETCKPETFEPCITVATELWNKGHFSEALQYYRMLFVTFLKQPKMNQKLQNETFIRETFDRYETCLRTVRADFTTLHKISTEWYHQCKTVFGASSSITVRSTLHLARVCQESKRYEHEAMVLYEELLHVNSELVDRREITSILDAMYEEEAYAASSNKSETMSSAQTERALKVLTNRTNTVRKSYGWAHEESLSKLTELVRFRSKQNETEMVQRELRETSIQVLSTEKSSMRLIQAASTIASNYIATNQVHLATQMTEEMYRQIVMKDTTNVRQSGFDVSSRGRESLVFLAQLEYSLRRNSATSVTVDEILAELTMQYVYFRQFREAIQSKTSFQEVTLSVARIYKSLVSTHRETAAKHVFEEYHNYFMKTEGRRLKFTKTEQIDMLLHTLMDHFSNFKSQDIVRSVGISANAHILQLLQDKKHHAACDLAMASFIYMSNSSSYRTPTIAKLVLIMGMNISGRHLSPQPGGACRKEMLDTSGAIIPNVLHVLEELNVSLQEFSLSHLNSLIALLGSQKNYKTLSWLLKILWTSRETKLSWHPSTTLALGRRFILAQYKVEDSMAAIRLAEDIVYNCRRVHGTRHPNTLEMSILLTQLYTSVAQRFQESKTGQDMATRLLKKSVAVHENIVRVLTDPAYAEMEDSLDTAHSSDGSDWEHAMSDDYKNGASDGEHVRQHMWYMKLALERLGGWPKDYSEYQRLSSDVFSKFAQEMKGMEGMDKWDLKKFGKGRAESEDDMLNANFSDWEVVDVRMGHGRQ
ncbi:NACHT domain protein [Stachybotrys elegans]|uniref:NACHT domain protein n=1 Tax=Stachybotrys elegans TaxID=80388 RepID=A0A8K0SWY6_9HYPO|nr:NACHT domain protein [Stachybotrys elegans]